jgi:hypothetical protein
MDYRKPRLEPTPYIEQNVEVWGKPVTVASMCHPMEIFRRLDESKQKVLYGLSSDKKLYVWDAYESDHQDIIEGLNITGDLVMITRSKDGYALVETKGNIMEAQGGLARLLNAPNVFCKDHSSNWVSLFEENQFNR